jgi:hypothetical protein
MCLVRRDGPIAGLLTNGIHSNSAELLYQWFTELKTREGQERVNVKDDVSLIVLQRDK